MAFVEDIDADAELSRIVELLGGRAKLHRHVRSRLDAHDLLHEGLPVCALSHLVGVVPLLRVRSGSGLQKAVGISLRTYDRKRQNTAQKLLSREQSGRVWKFTEILARATEIVGSQAEAEAWLDRPALALDQRKPLDLLATPVGIKSLDDHLGRVEHGVYT